MTELEKQENIELLRALENNLSIYTFEVKGDSFSVDVRSDFERAEKAIEKCPLFRSGYASSGF